MSDSKPPATNQQEPRPALPATATKRIRSPFWAELPPEHYVVRSVELPPTVPEAQAPEHAPSALQKLGVALGMAVAVIGATGGAAAMPASGPTTSISQTLPREADAEAGSDAITRATPAQDGSSLGLTLFHSLLQSAIDEAQHWAFQESFTALGMAVSWAIVHRKELPEKTRQTLARIETLLAGAESVDVVQPVHDATVPPDEMARRSFAARGLTLVEGLKRLMRPLLCGDESLAAAEGEALSKTLADRIAEHLALGWTDLAKAAIECTAQAIAKQGLRQYCATAAPEQAVVSG
jgi:hypothetical protein